MDYIAIDYSLVIPFLTVGGLLILLGLLISRVATVRDRRAESLGKPQTNESLFFLGIAISVLSFLATVALSVGLNAAVGGAASANQLKAFSEEIEATYGVELSYEQIQDLKYPRHMPEADFKSFGSTEIVQRGAGDGYIGTKTYLIWDENKMVLASSKDGENFEPLEAQN